MSRKLYFAELDENEKYVDVYEDDEKINTIVVEIDACYSDMQEWEILKIITESLNKDPQITDWDNVYYNIWIERV
ncbi:MAG: hypothetical protein ACTSQ8_08095 [Candidatus Helarchaeota archaeon]